MQIQRRGEGHHDWKLYGGAGRVGVEWYFRHTTDLPTSVMLYRLDPGAEEGEHFHLEGDPGSCSVVSEDEMYIVIAGEVLMTVGGESVTLRPGDAVYVPEGIPHSARNPGDETAELVLLFGPPDGNPLRSGGDRPAAPAQREVG